MKPLNPEVKRAADKIYEKDRQKYQKLIKWLVAAEHSYSPEVIVATLERFEPFADGARNWWSYLDKLLDQQEGKINAGKAQTESEQHKKESLGQFGAIMDRIAQSRKGLP